MEAVAKNLQNSLDGKGFPHAFLFHGPRGTGKTSTARIVAKYVNCKASKGRSRPCGRCTVCKSFEADTFIDLVEIDAASNRGIDDVRSLRKTTVLSPSVGSFKVYVIDEVHMMTKEAFNALLKTLEEPPRHCVFILCTTEREKIPATILSRCQLLPFRRARVEDIVAKLQHIAKSEQFKADRSVLVRIAEESDGGFRDAENMLEQIIQGGLSVDQIIGGVGDSVVISFVGKLIKGDINSLVLEVNRLFEDGVDLEVFVRKLVFVLRQVIYFKIGAEKDLFEGLEETSKQYHDLSSQLTLERLVKITASFSSISGKVNRNPFPPLPLELVIYSVCKDDDQTKSDKQPVAEQPGPNPVSVSSAPAGNNKFQWAQFLKKVKPHNHSIEALLRSCQFGGIVDDCLTIKAFYPFHKERLDSPNCLKILQEVLSSDFDFNGKITCTLSRKAPSSTKKEDVSDIIADAYTDFAQLGV